MNKALKIISLVCALVTLAACSSQPKSSKNGIALTQLNEVLEQAQAGDTIMIKSGEWSDVALKIKAQGTAEAPIVIKAHKNGEVIITGESTMKIGGEHIIIEGFYFKDGVLGSTPVITFKEGGKMAKYCRLTSCVIENYNPDDRFLKTDWIQLYGQHNQIDHCTFTDKYSSGLMLAVKLSNEESRNTNHKIEYNYFANRPRLGSNGGETVRIGTSTYSLDPAKVNFTNNYFEHCSGEVEILSVKATDNVVSGNVFYECEGVLALRHGNNNVVSNNTFIGNQKPNTGGIRVINAGHTITNNHFQDLTGYRFWSALAVMNGVPNSAINRYHQVKNVKIDGNTFINCNTIAFGVGTDGERTALPENVSFANNYIYNEKEQSIHFLDDMSGIDFKHNTINSKIKVQKNGFDVKALNIEEKNGIKLIKNGASSAKSIEKTECGATWFVKADQSSTSISTYEVSEASDLEATIKKVQDGDVIVLTEAKTYAIKKALVVNKKISLKKALTLDNNPLLKFESNTGDPLIIIAEGGDLSIDGVDFEGLSEGGIAPCAIRTQTTPFLTQFNLRVNNAHFYNFNAGGRTVFSATPSAIADTVMFTNSQFSNISGIAINLKAEKDDIGRYNAENVIVKNCLFYDVMGSAIDLYRGGNDESTSGPKLTLDHCTFYNVENRELGSSINLTGVQEATISNCVFSECGKSGRVIKMESPRWAKVSIDHCSFYHIGRIETFYNNRLGHHIWKLDPQFKDIDNKDFTLSHSSPLLNKSSEGKALGYVK